MAWRAVLRSPAGRIAREIPQLPQPHAVADAAPPACDIR
jgi:hypothetical protein